VYERSERIAARFELPMLVASLLVIPIIAIEQSDVSEPWDTIGAVLNWTTWAAFLAEAVTMLAVVPDRSRWLRDHPLEVAIVLLTPPFLPPTLQATRVFRLLVCCGWCAPPCSPAGSCRPKAYATLRSSRSSPSLGGGAAFAAVESDQPLSSSAVRARSRAWR
jgi:hypothetical protein